MSEWVNEWMFTLAHFLHLHSSIFPAFIYAASFLSLLSFSIYVARHLSLQSVFLLTFLAFFLSAIMSAIKFASKSSNVFISPMLTLFTWLRGCYQYYFYPLRSFLYIFPPPGKPDMIVVCNYGDHSMAFCAPLQASPHFLRALLDICLLMKRN